MTKEEEAAQLVTALESSFKKGYRYFNLAGHPLLTITQVLGELIINEEITVIEPDGEYSPIIHTGEVKRR